MKSPFPGMDPYLEQHWRDVHARLVIYGCDQIQGFLPSDLRARVEERVFVDYDDPSDGEDRSMYPDIRVIERGKRSGAATLEKGSLALAEPVIIDVGNEPMTEGFIEIIDIGTGNRVVTVIEFLSLANKLSGEGRNLYKKKQEEVLAAGVSLVEIDLLRGGSYVLSIPRSKIPRRCRTAYRAVVRRGHLPRKAEVYRVDLRERLPKIKVPLRETDPDVPLDLQALIEQCYRNSRYDDLDYTKEPVPPLSAQDRAWADKLLRGQGVRPPVKRGAKR